MTEEQVEKIQKLYNSYCRKESMKPYDEYDPEAIQVITQVLNILNLKVPGVNAR